MSVIKKAIAGIATVATISTALIGGGIVEDRYNKDIKIVDKMYSGKEYRTLKKNIGELADKNSESNGNMNYYQVKQYADILNIENKKCNGKTYQIETKKDIVGMLKKYNDRGCPK